MSIGIAPIYTRSRVNRAGDAIRRGTAVLEDYIILENWRASHSHVINTFQANLRRRTRGTDILVGQRLKRRATIIDKLTREDGMQLSRMHDIAGCRLIFPDIASLAAFREEFVSSRAKHERVTAERDQFNYLNSPKESGYRGIHDVYKYRSYADSADQWSGLLVEVQYRTKVQHAWATAVEIADLLTRSRGKFSEASEDYHCFFKACSEILARTQEESNSCLPKLSDQQLAKYFDRFNKKTKLLDILSKTNVFAPDIATQVFGRKLNTILVYKFEKGAKLEIITLDDTRIALEKYQELEREYSDLADVVLVRAEDSVTIMKVFQNYFTDARDFVAYLRKGRATLLGSRM